jgi:hypothetical protein
MKCPARVAIAACLVAPYALQAQAVPAGGWPQHSMVRPRPPVVDPGPGPTGPPAKPPSDAFVLFDGRDLSQWVGGDSSNAKWKVERGYAEVVPESGDIHTRHAFGDVQLHIEWATPSPPHGVSQEPGNSGVYLMSTYEIQVLDSYKNDTYPDGQAAATYGQVPPLVNASRPPGQWQTYDIVFRRPRFYPDGSLARPARVTVLHNGVLVQDNTELFGPTTHLVRKPYTAHADKLPLLLQDHGERVRFRNIWVRELTELP